MLEPVTTARVATPGAATVAVLPGVLTPVLVALLAVVALAACGGQSTPGPTQAVEDYVTAFAEGRFRVMSGLATGEAASYADYLVAGARSINGPAPVGAVQELALGDAEVDGDAGTVDGEVVFGEGGTPTTWRDFQLVRDGQRWLVADFLRDGRPLGDFLSRLEGKSTADHVQVAADLAFRNPSIGSVAVPVVISNDRAEDVDVQSYAATLTSAATGRSYRIEFSGPGVVAAGDHVDLVLIFDDVDDAAEGGTLAVALRESAGELVLEPPLVIPPFEPG